MLAAESQGRTEDGDGLLIRRIYNFLGHCGIPSARRLSIRANQGIVTISGTVASFYHRQLCTSACHRVAGVHRLIDEIKVA